VRSSTLATFVGVVMEPFQTPPDRIVKLDSQMRSIAGAARGAATVAGMGGGAEPPTMRFDGNGAKRGAHPKSAAASARAAHDGDMR